MPVRCRIVLVSMTKQGGCGIIYPSLMGRFFFMPKRSETRRSETGTKYKKGEESMKVYKKLMNALAAVEEVVLIISTLLILVLTVGNVFSRKVIHRSWSFTEELVVAILFKYGMDKVITQLANGKRTFVLNWPEWIFWSFVPIGAGCMILHFIEFCLDFCTGYKEKEDK